MPVWQGVDTAMHDIAARYEELKSVIETAADAIISIDADGTVRTFNLAAEHMFGHAAETVIGCSVNILMPAGDSEKHDGYIRRYLETGEARVIGTGREVQCLRADGRVFPAHLSVSASDVGGTTLFTAIIHDLSERQALEAELQRTREEHRLTLENAPIGIVVLRNSGRILEVNRAVLRMSGYDEPDLIGRPGIHFLHADDQIVVARNFRQLIETTLDTSVSTHRMRVRGDGYLTVQMHSAVVHDETGRATLLICMLQDLTRQREVEAELQMQRERLAHMSRLDTMGEMAVGLAHELNQPLTAITNYAQAGKRIIDTGAPELTDLAHACRNIAHQARRASRIIEKVRALTRRHKTTPTTVELPGLLEDLSELAEIDARHLGISIERRLEPVPIVYGDATQLEQVSLNFLRNAVDAMADTDCEGRRITLAATTRDDGWAEVTVVDGGPGVAPDYAAKVFEPFVSSKHEGMGMGLSISKSIIDAHGGEIGYRDNERGGATFWYALPPYTGEADA
ncbi:MAG: PAS domain S-box protein, partial [Pseudomonadota bacterium]